MILLRKIDNKCKSVYGRKEMATTNDAASAATATVVLLC